MSVLADSVSAALVEQEGGFVNSFVLLAEVYDSEGEPRWVSSTANDQTIMTTLGLLEWGRWETRRQLSEEDDDGE